MKNKLLTLAASLSLAALSALANTPNTGPIPNTNTGHGGQGPCGNPGAPDPPECPTSCETGDSNHFSSPAGSSCDISSINSYNGNAHRKITDLALSGSVGNIPLEFTRFSNTRLSTRNLIGSSFGPESPWSHNFDWLMRDNGGTAAQPIITVTSPEGKERSYTLKTGSTTEWIPTIAHKNPNRILSSGDDFTLHSGELVKYHFKRRLHTITGATFYRLEAIADPQSNTTTLTYNDNDDTRIRQITDPAGHFIKLHYQNQAIHAAAPVKLNPQPIVFSNNTTRNWLEITIPPSEPFRILAFHDGNQTSWISPRVNEIEFYDENNVKITGTTIGSAPHAPGRDPAYATDGDPATYYLYKYRRGGFCGIDLGPGNAKKVSRIRYVLTGSTNDQMKFVGINNNLAPTEVLSHIEASDGRIIDYDYTIHTDPSGLFQWSQLSRATYPDAATATYAYKSLHDFAMPVIDSVNDPRYIGTVKQARYDYDNNAAIGFVTKQYDNATDQLLVTVGWDGIHTPKFIYPNGKIHRFEYQSGNLRRALNSDGAATDYGYNGSFVGSIKDPHSRTTTYLRRTSDYRLIRITTPGGDTTIYTRDTPGYLTAVTRNGKTTTHIRDAQNRITRTTHPDGTFEEWTYNTFGQKLTHRLRNATAETWTYSPTGLLTQHTDPAGSLTTYTHNALNRLASETRHLDSSTAHTTSYEYNDRGEITQITHPDATFVQHAYDYYGNRLTTLDERGQLTERTYDSLGRKLTETDPNGHIVRFPEN